MRSKIVLGVIAVLLVTASLSYAGERFDYGFYLRLRQEYLRNVYDFNNQSATFDNENRIRLKLSAWGKWNFSKDAYLFAKLTGEPRYYVFPEDKDFDYS